VLTNSETGEGREDTLRIMPLSLPKEYRGLCASCFSLSTPNSETGDAQR